MSPARSVRERATRPCRVLIADAHTESREFYRTLLKETGCDVIEAVDGRDALISALGHCPSLVIADTRLPIFDGFQLFDVLRRDVLTRSVPILIVTSEPDESELKRAQEAGVDSVLVKPVTPEALLREVQRLLRHPPKPDEPRRDTASHRKQAKPQRATND